MEEPNYFIDLGGLALFDTNECSQSQDLEERIFEQSKRNFLLFRKKLSLHKQEFQSKLQERKLEHQFIDFDKDDNLLELPPKATLFPRFKKMPSKPILTKWEEFARKKGIKKKQKRNKKVWNEETKEYVRRYGKGGVQDIKRKMDVAREAKPGEEYDDPFERDSRQKKIQKVQQRVNEQRNKLIKKGFDPKTLERKSKKAPLVQKIQTVQNQIEKTKKSTASLGKFDPITKKEVSQKKITVNSKPPQFKGLSDEMKRNKGILKKVLM